MRTLALMLTNKVITKGPKTVVSVITLFLLTLNPSSVIADVHHQVSGIIQAGIVYSDTQTSFLNSGTGVTRYDTSGLKWNQGVVQIESDYNASFTSTLVLNSYAEGDQKLGPSQAFVQYQPLRRSDLKYRIRMGMFYPELSVENTDIAWLSPDTYTQSAINSWFGEELRIFGIEASLFKSGRRQSSPWSWDARLGVYKGNDPLGSVIAWRGFATHDRQSLFDERLEFAPYPSVISEDLINHPAWVEAFSELDTRVGAYLGVHLSYLRQTQFKYYYYDNFADPNVVNSLRLYAWRTKFHSLGLQHQVNKTTGIKAQFLVGSTLMGDNFVHVDYLAAFAQVTRKIGQDTKVTGRVDVFDVNERDDIPQDNNNSHGYALTFTVKQQISDSFTAGVEFHFNKNRAANRAQLEILQKQIERQALLIGEFRF